MPLLNFGWLGSNGVGGCAYPGSEVALAALNEDGVALLINLAERAQTRRRSRATSWSLSTYRCVTSPHRHPRNWKRARQPSNGPSPPVSA